MHWKSDCGSGCLRNLVVGAQACFGRGQHRGERTGDAVVIIGDALEGWAAELGALTNRLRSLGSQACFGGGTKPGFIHPLGEAVGFIQRCCGRKEGEKMGCCGGRSGRRAGWVVELVLGMGRRCGDGEIHACH